MTLDRNRPLLICDVDEVVVHFIQSLEAHLHENDCWLDTSSFALNGNVRKKVSNEPVETGHLWELLADCFEARTRIMDPIVGASESLSALSAHTEIVMLTNLPERYKEDRVANLLDHGMPYPVVSNSGEKGPAVRALLKGMPHTTFFIDDSPNNIRSVGESCPDVHLVHFIPDARFARHVEPLDGVALRTDTWTDTHSFIHELLRAEGTI